MNEIVTKNNETVTNNKNRWLCISAILLMYAAGKSFGYEYISYAASIIAVVYCLFGPIDSSLMLLFSIYPNTYFTTFDSKSICGFLAIFCVFRLVLKIGYKVPVRTIFVSAVFLLYGVLLFLLNGNSQLFMASIKIVSFAMVLAMLPLCYRERSQLRTMIFQLGKACVFGTVIGEILGIFHYVLHGLPFIPTSAYPLRFIGLANDPNYLSSTFCFAISLILVQRYMKKSFSKFDLLLVCFLSVLGFITMSRGFIVCWLLIMLFYLIVNALNRSHKVQFKYVALAVASLAVAMVFFGDKIAALLDSVVFRFTAEQYSGGGGRIEVWQWYLGRFVSTAKSILFGSEPAVTLFEAGVINHIEHNTYIQMLYELGIFGTVIFSATIVSPLGLYTPVLNQGASRTKRYIKILPLFAAASPYFFLSALTGENFCLSLMFAFIYMKYVEYDDSNAEMSILDRME